ncbi:MAG: phosphate/phosphite/phosphonate ABC transporter substrate-binding protein [Candidatus Binatia bacterium]
MAAFALLAGLPAATVATQNDSRTDSRTGARTEFEIAEKAPRGAVPSLFGEELLEPGVLGVGRIARDVSEHLPRVEAMAAYLSPRIAALGFTRARPVLARDNAEMADFLRRGIVDLFSESPVSAVHLAETAGALILLRERREGSATYSSVIFVRSDSPVRTLSDLRGRRVAFEDAGSTTTCLLPLAAIKSAGVETALLEEPASPPVPGVAAYYFTLSESSIPTAVARSAADAGALSNLGWDKLNLKMPAAVARLRVIHTSQAVPRAFAMTGPAVTPSQRDGLRALLLAMQDSADGREVLQEYGDVDGFDTINAALEGDIAGLESTYALVREEMR